jgi:hypothetical protein
LKGQDYIKESGRLKRRNLMDILSRGSRMNRFLTGNFSIQKPRTNFWPVWQVVDKFWKNIPDSVDNLSLFNAPL